MSPDVISAQANTLTEWAEQWSREEKGGAGEVAFLLSKAARAMRGDETALEGYIGQIGGADASVLTDDLPPATVQTGIVDEE